MTKQFGQSSELFVINYLVKQNFKILAHNYQKFFGEIDIIAQQNNLIVFVEVKARKNSTVSLHQLVTHTKQQKIIKTAKHFMSQHISIMQNKVLRFDVALLHLQDHKEPELTYVENAFQNHGQ